MRSEQMSEQQFGWNYFENEVVIGDKQDKKRMIVIVLSNFMDIPYNRKSFDELVDWLNELSEENNKLKEINKDKEQDVLHLYKENERLKNKLNVTALELVDEAISMGKAVEISEMSYREFIDYRAENGKPMELQL